MPKRKTRKPYRIDVQFILFSVVGAVLAWVFGEPTFVALAKGGNPFSLFTKAMDPMNVTGMADNDPLGGLTGGGGGDSSKASVAPTTQPQPEPEQKSDTALTSTEPQPRKKRLSSADTALTSSLGTQGGGEEDRKRKQLYGAA